MSKPRGYPHKQPFNLKTIQRNRKVNAWYRRGRVFTHHKKESEE
jgi:hypothetical protein